jgi:ribulose-5-phosphate 4-epimerase/fuculose-1-phosphate aldolase
MMIEEITASSFKTTDIEGNSLLKTETGIGINPAGYITHSADHSSRRDAGCVIHSDTRASAAVAAMKAGLPPLSQGAIFLYGEVSTHDFEGSALRPEERRQLVEILGANNVMICAITGRLQSVGW